MAISRYLAIILTVQTYKNTKFTDGSKYANNPLNRAFEDASG